MGVLVGTLALVALSGQAAPLPLVTERLPGFQVDLPRGDSRTGEPGDYEAGSLRILDGKRSLALVTWRPAGGSRRADAGDARAAAAALGLSPGDLALNDKVAIPGGLKGETWMVRPKKDPGYWQTTVMCGGRSVSIITGAATPGFEALHQRMVRSFQCHPDVARYRRGTPVPRRDVALALTLPPEWRRVGPPQADRLFLTDGQYIFSAVDLGPKVSEESLDRLLTELAEPNMRLGARQGSDWPIEAKADPTTGWVTVRRCPEMKQTLLLMALVESRDRKKTDAARALLGKARCLAPGEPAQSWPEENPGRR